MQKAPDVIGFKLDEGIEALKACGLYVHTMETSSPKITFSASECRIINQKEKNNSVELIISYF